MPKRPVGVLSLGILIVCVAVSAAALSASILTNIFEMFSVTLALFGFWIIVLAAMQAATPEQYGVGAFGTFSGGILMAAVGVGWFLSTRGLFNKYFLPLLLLVIGILVVITGIRAWRT